MYDADSAKSARGLPFQSLGLAVVGFQVRVDFRLVRVVVGQSRVHLRQRQAPSERLDDLIRDLAHIVPSGDAAHGNT